MRSGSIDVRRFIFSVAERVYLPSPLPRFMRPYVMLIFLFFSGCAPGGGQTALSCTRFKTGSFITADDSFHVTIRTIRTDSFQTEINLATRTRQVSRIVWTGDCAYDLYKVVSDGLHPTADSIRGNKALHV